MVTGCGMEVLVVTWPVAPGHREARRGAVSGRGRSAWEVSYTEQISDSLVTTARVWFGEAADLPSEGEN